MAATAGLVAHWRRESEQLRHESRLAVDADRFELAAKLRAEADVLLARADDVTLDWPLRPLVVA